MGLRNDTEELQGCQCSCPGSRLGLSLDAAPCKSLCDRKLLYLEGQGDLANRSVGYQWG